MAEAKQSLEQLEDQFTKYEIARILGARALQVAMDAPLLLKIPEKDLDEINFNPLEISKKELLADVLPITVNRPLPNKREDKIKVLSKKEVEELKKKEEEEKQEAEKKAEAEIEAETNKEAPIQAAEEKADEVLEKQEQAEEKKVAEDAEIMELAKPEDEQEDTGEEKPVEV
jgi:DNA-directed RNA polymerase subunit K